jgi:alpha-ketoglutarate-dependent taurine dioxygenase
MEVVIMSIQSLQGSAPGQAAAPLMVHAPGGGVDELAWAREHRAEIEEALQTAGALLFRGFDIDGSEAFNRFVEAVSEAPLEYRERSSPRSQVDGNVYTSTDYPPEFPIFLHNESSYSSAWPLKLFFYCQTAATTGGETPISETRHILSTLDPALRRRFVERGVMYVRNFGPGLGLPWSTVFGTDDRAAVEAYCRGAGMTCEWLGGERLRTRHVRPAVATHPRLGQQVWFNHATFFHVSTLEPMIRDALLAAFAEDELPNNTYYGDGSSIETSALDELRGLYTAGTVAFPWEQGDVMLVDNMLVAHGRASYTGKRKVLVAMTERTTAAAA